MGFPDVWRNIQGAGGRLELGWKKATNENQIQTKRKKTITVNSLRKEKVELSEINQTEKYKDYVIPYMWKPEYKTDGYYKTEADSETQRMVTNGERSERHNYYVSNKWATRTYYTADHTAIIL